MQLIIFTDLDGTLLDHDSYSVDGARTALDRIARLEIPLVFTTSKTRAEVEYLLRTLALSQPFIVENGGGLFFPSRISPIDQSCLEPVGPYRLRRFGLSYSTVRNFVKEQGPYFGVRGFGDMTIAEVATLTDLSPSQAKLAKMREFTEPFVCNGSIDQFIHLAEGRGFAVARGGRFYHLMGRGQDKGRAVRETVRIWYGVEKKVVTIGLGDSPNDEPLLANVDVPVLVPKLDGSLANINVGPLVLAPSPGSHGWGAVIMKLLDAWETKSGLLAMKKTYGEDGHG